MGRLPFFIGRQECEIKRAADHDDPPPFMRLTSAAVYLGITVQQMTSTRRFFCRPASVSLVAMGWVSP